MASKRIGQALCAPWTDAVCACGHYLVDHRAADWNYTTGKITMAECLDCTCPCKTYKSAARS